MIDGIHVEGLRLRRMVAAREQAQTTSWMIERDMACSHEAEPAKKASGWVAIAALAAGALALWFGMAITLTQGMTDGLALPDSASTDRVSAGKTAITTTGMPLP